MAGFDSSRTQLLDLTRVRRSHMSQVQPYELAIIQCNGTSHVHVGSCGKLDPANHELAPMRMVPMK